MTCNLKKVKAAKPKLTFVAMMHTEEPPGGAGPPHHCRAPPAQGGFPTAGALLSGPLKQTREELEGRWKANECMTRLNVLPYFISQITHRRHSGRALSFPLSWPKLNSLAGAQTHILSLQPQPTLQWPQVHSRCPCNSQCVLVLPVTLSAF